MFQPSHYNDHKPNPLIIVNIIYLMYPSFSAPRQIDFPYYCRPVTTEQLMYVKEDLIIPQVSDA